MQAKVKSPKNGIGNLQSKPNLDIPVLEWMQGFFVKSSPCVCLFFLWTLRNTVQLCPLNCRRKLLMTSFSWTSLEMMRLSETEYIYPSSKIFQLNYGESRVESREPHSSWKKHKQNGINFGSDHISIFAKTQKRTFQ